MKQSLGQAIVVFVCFHNRKYGGVFSDLSGSLEVQQTAKTAKQLLKNSD